MKTKIILSISILGLLLCTNTVSADNFVTNWYNTNITGRIESPIQQGCSNTCWLLSAVTGLNQTETGKAIIADTVKPDDNGGAVVTFKGLPNNPINVSAEELAKFDSSNSTNNFTLSTGDADMRAIEIAAQKVYQGGDFPSRLADDVQVGRVNTDQNFTFQLLTGSNQANWQIDLNWFEFAAAYFFLPDGVTRLKDSDIDNFNNSDQYSTVSFKNDNFYATDINTGKQQKIVSDYGHEYTILSSDDNFVYLYNPWGDTLKISRDDFTDATPSVWTQKLDLNMVLPKTDLFSFLEESGVVFDYDLTDEDYGDIFDGYDFYKDFNIEDSIDYDYNQETTDEDSQEVVGGSDYDEDSDLENNAGSDFIDEDNQEIADGSQELIYPPQENDGAIILCGETYKNHEDFVARYDPGHVYGDKIEKITQEIGKIMVEEGLLHEKINHGTDGYSGLGIKCNNSCSAKYCLDGCTEDYYSCIKKDCTPIYEILEPYRLEYDKFSGENFCSNPEGVSRLLDYHNKLDLLINVAKKKIGEYEN